MKKALLSICCALAIFSINARAEDDLKATVLKHLKTSEDFTLKVADAMPAADYSFKLTPGQMSFAGQLVHLSQGMTYFLSAFSGQKPNPAKPASEKKDDVIAFVKTSYEGAIQAVSALTPEQMAKEYKSEEGTATGTSLLLGMLDHTTHHRASAEMYLRAKGITPPTYEF